MKVVSAPKHHQTYSAPKQNSKATAPKQNSKATAPKQKPRETAPKQPHKTSTKTTKTTTKLTNSTTKKVTVTNEHRKDHFESGASGTKTKNQTLTFGDKKFNPEKGGKNPQLKVSGSAQKVLDKAGPMTLGEASGGRDASPLKNWESSFTSKQLQGSGTIELGSGGHTYSGSVSLSGKGLSAKGELSSTMNLAYAQGSLVGKYGAIGVNVNGTARLGTTVSATGELTINPTKGVYAVKVGGESFAGFKAGVTTSTTLAKYATLGTKAEVWAGMGGTAQLDVGLRNGKLKLKGQLGAALGIGGSIGVNGELDFKALKADGKQSLKNLVTQLNPHWRTQLGIKG